MRIEPTRKPFLLSLSAPEREMLKAVAKSWGVSMSAAMRRLLREAAGELDGN